jgi:hypothetical protein
MRGGKKAGAYVGANPHPAPPRLHCQQDGEGDGAQASRQTDRVAVAVGYASRVAGNETASLGEAMSAA